MNWWVQTRGRAVDYRVIGRAPEPARWWSPYLRLTAPEAQMLIVETGLPDWRMYLTAMHSGRHDAAAPPRPIRNSLLLEGTAEEGAVLARVISAYHARELEELLRQHLRPDRLDGWLAGTPVDADTDAALGAALGAIGTAHNGVEQRGTWSGAVGSVAACGSFAGACRFAAERGTRGVFAHLNLMSDPREALALPEVAAAEVRVFLLDGGTDALVALEDPGTRGANPPAAGPSPQTGAGRQRRKRRSLVVRIRTAVLLFCLLLLLLL